MKMNISMAVFRVLGVTLMLILIVEGSTRVTRDGLCGQCRKSQKFINDNLNYCTACHSSPMSKKIPEAAIYSDVRQPVSDAEFLTQMIENTNDLLGNVIRLLQFEKEQLERIESKSGMMSDEELKREQNERQKLLILRNMLRQ